jgi:hypothetical protein
LIHHRAGDLSRFKLRRSHDTAEEQYGEGDEYNQRKGLHTIPRLAGKASRTD